MGLDLVELALEVEETFGIVITDDAGAEIRTVGQLYEYILQCRQQRQPCPTGEAFYAIRRAIVEAGDVPKRAIRPSVRLETVLPKHTRRRVWKAIHGEWLGYRAPNLRLPYRLGPLLTGLILLLGAAAAVKGGPLIGMPHALVLSAAGTAVGLILVLSLTRPFAVGFPPRLETVGDLALACLPPNYEAAARKQWADEEVWLKLQSLVVDMLGVKPKEVTPSARFHEDLGAG